MRFELFSTVHDNGEIDNITRNEDYIMVSQKAITLGVAATVLVVGGISLKYLAGRRNKTTGAVKPLALTVAAAGRVDEPAPAIVSEETEVIILPCEVIEPGVTEVHNVVDNVVFIGGDDGEAVLSVSRPRLPLAPMFWSHFAGNIRRQEIVNLREEDFVDRTNWSTDRGWHKCVLNGAEGILHVTKGHVSAVVFDSGSFHGISTSPSRFNGRGLVNLTADRAKAYLQGH